MRNNNLLKISTFFIWAAFSLLNISSADSSTFIKPLTLSSPPCLTALDDSSYEWGTLKDGICYGVTDQLAFPLLGQQAISNQILWVHSAIETGEKKPRCLQTRGLLEDFPETGMTDCLCAVTQSGGFHSIGIEQPGNDGKQRCKTKNQSFPEYFIARHPDSLINVEPPPSGNILGYIAISTGIALSALALCEWHFGMGPLHFGAALAEIFYFYNFSSEDELMEVF